MGFPFSPGDIPTAADLNALPRGFLGYAQVTANQTGISSEVDLTGLSVTLTPAASRRIRISFQVAYNMVTTAGSAQTLIKEGSTVFTDVVMRIETVGVNATATGSVVITPSAASHTYKLTAAKASGGNTMNVGASSTRPGFILVEDLGPA